MKDVNNYDKKAYSEDFVSHLFRKVLEVMRFFNIILQFCFLF
jgi:hypothetical protein